MGQQCHQLCILCHFYQFPCCWKAVSSCQCVSYALFFNVLPASPITCNSLWFINCHVISDSQKCFRFFFTSLEFSIILLSIKITVSRKNSPGKKPPVRDQGRVRFMLGVELGLESVRLFSGGNFYLEPKITVLNYYFY